MGAFLVFKVKETVAWLGKHGKHGNDEITQKRVQFVSIAAVCALPLDFYFAGLVLNRASSFVNTIATRRTIQYFLHNVTGL